MAQFFSSNFPEQALTYINSHFFGAKYIAERNGVSVQELNRIIDNENNPNYLNNILFYAGAEISVSLFDELFVSPNTMICRGGYYIIKKRMTIKSLVRLCDDFTEGGNLLDGDIYRLINVLDRLFVVIVCSSNVYIIEIERSWKHYDNTKEILIKQTSNFQCDYDISALTRSIVTKFIIEFDGILIYFITRASKHRNVGESGVSQLCLLNS